MNDILNRLTAATVASCTCTTKSPVSDLHAMTCRYRILEDARQTIATTWIALIKIATDENLSIYDARTTAKNALDSTGAKDVVDPEIRVATIR